MTQLCLTTYHFPNFYSFVITEICNKKQGLLIRKIRLKVAKKKKKKKVFDFVGADQLRTKIIINDETVEQVSQFTYLGCSISYQFSSDVE